ncbi:hypothetical protein S225a_06810 [Candidatus Brocadiaceae bacterium S225]|nr:hypothetical protein S225a_06810 [Candidatus Brocadiaceae bacterium S225]
MIYSTFSAWVIHTSGITEKEVNVKVILRILKKVNQIGLSLRKGVSYEDKKNDGFGEYLLKKGIVYLLFNCL